MVSGSRPELGDERMGRKAKLVKWEDMDRKQRKGKPVKIAKMRRKRLGKGLFLVRAHRDHTGSSISNDKFY